MHFYPRSPCGERRGRRVGLPVAGHFYPRSPCGERQARRASRQQPAGISIHALLAESDTLTDDVSSGGKIFLSTLSLRRATLLQDSLLVQGHNFYPRSPCGERRWNNRLATVHTWRFLSTLSLRRATKYPAILGSAGVISIHALLAESDYHKSPNP